MKPLVRLSLSALLAGSLFGAQHAGAVANGGRVGATKPGSGIVRHNAVRDAGRDHFGYGRQGFYGYGYAGLYDDYLGAPSDFTEQAPSAPERPAGILLYGPPSSTVRPPEVAHPVMHDYTQAASHEDLAPASNQPVIHLLAFRDSTVRASTTYWVEGGTLHYLDTTHKQRQAPLSSVDRDLSAQLNSERHVPFELQ